MNASADRRPVAWHVGRRGEVPGGMTQVVNSYLGWTFDRWRVGFLASRDGGRGVRSMLLPIGALLRIAMLGSRRRNLVVVHLSQGGSFVREGLLLRWAALIGLRTVAHLHGSEFVAFADAQPAKVGRVLRAATRIFVLNDDTRAAVERFVPADRVQLVANAVATGTLRDKTRTVVFGGSVSRRKGVDILTAAWSGLTDRGDWRLEIVGPPTDADLVDADLPAATFHGTLPHNRLMQMLETASIAVLPSRAEGMPMFILEAWARGAAVIGSRVGGIPALLGDGAGVLVDPADIEELRTALQTLLHDDDRRRAVAETGVRRFAREYSAEALYPQLEQAWSAALAAEGSASTATERGRGAR